jgi:hypothetical protein
MNYWIGETPCEHVDREVTGQYVTLDGEQFYRIANYDRMAPFFMTLVSHSDHWMFLSSNGGLTAGRRNPRSALFPYYSDDKIHDAGDLTGSKTLVFVEHEGREQLWEPFERSDKGVYELSRNLYKNVIGNKLVFEEINHSLGVVFSYAWNTSERFGFVRRAKIRNLGNQEVRIQMIDGIQNLLPAGVDARMQSEFSTLVDAYKRNELLTDGNLGLFTLSSIPSDRPQPSESLEATVVWCEGLDGFPRLLSARQLDAFRRQRPVVAENETRAVRGAYFVQARCFLPPQGEKQWHIVAEVEQDAAQVIALSGLLASSQELACLLQDDIQHGSAELSKLVAGADGLQVTDNQLRCARHFSNVLFNIMRGGIFDQGDRWDKADLKSHLKTANAPLATRYAEVIDALPDRFTRGEAQQALAATGSADLVRLYYEYLPLVFSRRHGDPSRPWNQFSIEIRTADGSRNRSYQGNWRDIFQNWEALCWSFPCYVDSVISKFVNATTPDGYNPYRITRDGIEWETVDEMDDWSNIGYWGDHQIIYLLKLLELSRRFFPDQLRGILSRDQFAYANVPYRIRSYEQVLQDPHNSLDFDKSAQHQIDRRVATTGSDGKLVWDKAGHVYHVNFTEKLLVPLLAKLSNLIPDAGIWMNTQRPEWNDANNALVGYGVSMVTMYYLRRYLAFCEELFGHDQAPDYLLSAEVADYLTEIRSVLEDQLTMINGPSSDQQRRTLLEGLGKAGSKYRETIYREGFSGERAQVRRTDLVDFFRLALSYVEHSISTNRRDDHLYHAYNLMKVEPNGGISRRHLYEMLEGQVAVLSSGFLSAEEAVKLLGALRESALFRADQHSYLLYPNRELPRFLEKNQVSPEAVANSPLLARMVLAGDRRVVVQDIQGGYHFCSTLHNLNDLVDVLQNINAERRHAGEQELDGAEIQQVLQLYDEVFDHQSFTGRSGTFFGYEGLGCVYWHMVSKLRLAVQEVYELARRSGVEPDTVRQLAHCYEDIRAGLGDHKTPAQYGAFPTDAYSHTPANSGAKQPGMTGQVKEDVLARFGELGLSVQRGRIVLDPSLLKEQEFLREPAAFDYYDTTGSRQRIQLPPGSIGFTYCQTPFVYYLSDPPSVRVTWQDGTITESTELTLDAQTSQSIFDRRNDIRMVEVRGVLTSGT